MDKVYRIFVNGKFLNGSDKYEEIFNRALGIVLFLNMTDCFLNTKSPLIIDKWKDKTNTIIITKNQ